ncbi:MAG: type II toxin-antitoxin system HicA family toxin [Verrucomicrobiota bacterium]
MAKHQKLLEHIMMRRGDANVDFGALCRLLKKLGFEERIKGDHHIFTMTGVEEILNLQTRIGMAKPYQVNQVRSVILRYKLTLGE